MTNRKSAQRIRRASVAYWRATPDYTTYDDWPQRTGAALTTLDQLQPQAKQKLIEGLVRTIANDGILKVEESELLRTTCALLHCPMPILH